MRPTAFRLLCTILASLPACNLCTELFDSSEVTARHLQQKDSKLRVLVKSLHRICLSAAILIWEANWSITIYPCSNHQNIINVSLATPESETLKLHHRMHQKKKRRRGKSISHGKMNSSWTGRIRIYYRNLGLNKLKYIKR